MKGYCELLISHPETKKLQCNILVVLLRCEADDGTYLLYGPLSAGDIMDVRAVILAAYKLIHNTTSRFPDHTRRVGTQCIFRQVMWCSFLQKNTCTLDYKQENR